MGVQTYIKLPFRAARAGYRLVRDVVAPVEPPRGGAAASDADAGRKPTRINAETLAAEAAAEASTPIKATPVVEAAVAVPKPPAPAPEPRVPVAIRVEETPNPDARKFVCSRKLVEKGSLVFNDAASAADVPFALAVFELGGIRTVFATRDFVTVTRLSDAPGWRELQPRIEAALRESLAR